MKYFLIAALFFFSFNAYPSQIPEAGKEEFNKKFISCTLISDEIFLEIHRLRHYYPKGKVLSFVGSYANTQEVYDFYKKMVSSVYANKDLSIEKQSGIFFKECMTMINDEVNNG